MSVAVFISTANLRKTFYTQRKLYKKDAFPLIIAQKNGYTQLKLYKKR